MDASIRRSGDRATHGAVAENSYLTTDAAPEDPMNQLPGHSITYRVAVGPRQGAKCSPKAPTVGTLQTLPACEPDDYADSAGNASGFSLHAGVYLGLDGG